MLPVIGKVEEKGEGIILEESNMEKTDVSQ